MPEAGAIRAGRAYVEVGTDNNPLKRGLANAGAMLKGLSTVALGVTAGLAAAGAGVAAGLFAATKAFADSGSELADMSARTDTSVESLSALKYAAEQTGASGEALEAGLRKMLQTVQLASEGSKKATAALDRLGLTAKDFAGKSPDQMIGLNADAADALTLTPPTSRRCAHPALTPPGMFPGTRPRRRSRRSMSTIWRTPVLRPASTGRRS